jgi:hypothetical protein
MMILIEDEKKLEQSEVKETYIPVFALACRTLPFLILSNKFHLEYPCLPE